MVDGHGGPNSSSDFTHALDALHPLSCGPKFASRKEIDRDHVVPPLEGLWWAETELAFTSERDKSAWSWTMLVMVPDWITPATFA